MNPSNFKAIYGTFDHHMMPLEVTDVTSKIAGNYLSNGKINLPAQTNFSEIFDSPIGNKRKFLQIQYGNRKYNIIEDNYRLDILIDLNECQKHIKLVYYAYINRASNWETIVSGQLLQLKGYGILDEVDMFVHLTEENGVFEDAMNVVRSICPNAIISLSTENQFEYPALKLLYDLAVQSPESIFIYLHTKGISYNIPSRIPIDIALLKGTFENWRRNLEAFSRPKINKIGLFPSFENPGLKDHYGIGEGWVRYNFWYARGSYIVQFCQEPKVDYFRHYWEIWLGGGVDNNKKRSIYDHDSYNLYLETNQKYFNVTEAEMRMDYLKRILTEEDLVETPNLTK